MTGGGATDNPAVQELLRCIASLLADQHGNMVLIDVKRLKKYGYRSSSFALTHQLLRELLKSGVRDPLGRGVWVYFSESGKRYGRSGRRRYLAVRRDSPE